MRGTKNHPSRRPRAETTPLQRICEEGQPTFFWLTLWRSAGFPRARSVMKKRAGWALSGRGQTHVQVPHPATQTARPQVVPRTHACPGPHSVELEHVP
jgi:hypothetical protein